MIEIQRAEYEQQSKMNNKPNWKKSLYHRDPKTKKFGPKILESLEEKFSVPVLKVDGTVTLYRMCSTLQCFLIEP
jgi:hypothetical protein